MSTAGQFLSTAAASLQEAIRRSVVLASSSPSASAPPSLTGGAELQGDSASVGTGGVQISLDWLRFVGTGPEEYALEWCFEKFGAEAVTCPPRFRCVRAWRWGSGVSLHVGHEAGCFVLEMPGSFLATMPPDARVDLAKLVLENVGLNATPRRVDVAIDFIGQNVSLCKSAWASAIAGELVGAKSKSQMLTESGELITGHTVYFGKRGNNGSGRFVRVYDKGLETGLSKVAGEWERYEVEFYDECAETVLASMCSNVSAWRETAVKYALGSIDFRQVNATSRSLERRPRCEWWSNVLGLIETARAVMPRTFATLKSAVSWMRGAVAPILTAMREKTGQSLGELWSELGLDDVRPTKNTLASPVLYEFLKCRETPGALSLADLYPEASPSPCARIAEAIVEAFSPTHQEKLWPAPAL